MTGIEPAGNRVVVKPDDVERKTEGGIIIPDKQADQHAHAQTIGTLVAVGPDAWRHVTKKRYRLIDGEFKLVEMETSGYSKPFAEVGDRIAFAKYGGLVVEGEDGEQYRILNDEDVTAKVSDEVSFTGLQSRKRVGIQEARDG